MKRIFSQLFTLHERLYSSGIGKWGIGILMSIVFLAILGPVFSGHQCDVIDLTQPNEPPSFRYWFGTDDLGRDVFTRVCFGARISILVGLSAALIDLGIGLLWGGFSGIFGGWIDEVMMRSADILYSLPYLLVVIIISVFLGSGIISLLIAICAVGWITMARIIRGQILHLKEMDYILASRCLGATTCRLLVRHLIPVSLGPIIVTLTMTIPSAIFAEAFLSFLGLGLQAPQASLGTMAYEGLASIEYYPWRLFFPAMMISLTILSFHLIAEGIKKVCQRDVYEAASA